jgi:hypothetical protein
MRHVVIDLETDIADLQGGRKVREKINVPNLVVGTWQCWMDELEGLRPDINSWHWNDRKDIVEQLAEWLQDPNTLIYGQNFPFDLRVLLKEYPILEAPIRSAVEGGRIFDTQVLARIREPCAKSFHLASMAKRYLGKEIEGKNDIRTTFTRKHRPTPEQMKYARDDVEVTAELVKWLAKQGHGSIYQQTGPIPFARKRIICASKGSVGEGIGPWHPIDRLYCKAWIMVNLYTEPLAWHLDKELLAKMYGEAKDTTEELAKKLYEAGLMRRDRNDKAQVVPIGSAGDQVPRKWTLNEETLTYERRWKGQWQHQPGKWVLDQKVIRRRLQALGVKHSLGDVPVSVKTNALSLTYDYWKQHEALLEADGMGDFLPYARQQKYISSFYGPLNTVVGDTVHPRYWVPGAETLRWAAARPCIHQVPKKLRPLYRAPPGKVIVGADYSALELYTLVHLMSCLGIEGPMMETLKSGVDPHAYAASLLVGGPASWHQYTKDSDGAEQRQQAKALNFGVPGGMGARTVYKLGRQAYGLPWSFSEAKGLFHHYKDKFWDVQAYLDLFQANVYDFRNRHESRSDFLTRLGFPEGGRWPSRWDIQGRLDYGRFFDVQLPTGAIIPARNYTQGANCGFQSLGAQVCTLAYTYLVEAGFDVIAQIHDALYCVVDPKEAEQYGLWLCVIMRKALKEVCTKAPAQTLEHEIKETLF